MGVIDCHGSFEYSSMQRDVVSKVSSTKAQAEGLTQSADEAKLVAASSCPLLSFGC
jgi:hypothetical protein